MSRSTGNLSQELQQRLQQRLNPQNVALGRVLEMNTPEFEDEVRRQLDDNPALEAVSGGESHGDDFNESPEQLQLADYADSDDAPSYLSQMNQSAAEGHTEAANYTADDNRSMSDILMERLTAEGAIDDSERVPATYIIGNIDENGYLTRPLADIADDMAMSEGLYVDTADLQRIFDEIRELDPPGIGATDLRDCLLLQLDRREASKPVLDAREIIDRHFELFSKKHFDRLAAAAHLSRQELEDALAVIRTLNPKPGQSIVGSTTADRTQHVVPDMVVDYNDETDSFTISHLTHPRAGHRRKFPCRQRGKASRPRKLGCNIHTPATSLGNGLHQTCGATLGNAAVHRQSHRPSAARLLCERRPRRYKAHGPARRRSPHRA